MQVSQEVNTASYRIHAYAPGELVISYPRWLAGDTDSSGLDDDNSVFKRETILTSLIVMPERLIRDWPPLSFEALKTGHFELLSRLQPEIVLFGSGKRCRHPRTALIAPLLTRGIGVETMDTGAACRTYNILMADERKVAAALLLD